MLPDINTLLKPRPKKYRNLVKHIQRDLAFSEGDSTDLTIEELFSDLTTNRGTARFLGALSKKSIESVLTKFGFFDHLAHKGLVNPIVELDTKDSFQHRIQVSHKIRNDTLLSGELVMRRSTFKTPSLNGTKYPPADLLIVEWFLLQNPLKRFSYRRPQLPGQDYPGFGFTSTIFEIFYWFAKRLQADGVVLVPNYLHTGILYGRRFIFVNPKKQGTLRAMDKMLGTTTNLTQLSWACSEGQLINRNTNDIFIWKPAPMVLPASRSAKEYFGAKIYNDVVNETQKLTRFKINKGYKKRFNSNWEAIKC